MHSGSLEPSPDGILASGFHYSGGRAEPLRLESGVTHAMSILLEIGAGRFRFLVVSGLGGKLR